jgi:hypothetical protein
VPLTEQECAYPLPGHSISPFSFWSSLATLHDSQDSTAKVADIAPMHTSSVTAAEVNKLRTNHTANAAEIAANTVEYRL